MIVNGNNVPQEIIAACIARMKQEPFKAMEIQSICERMGICSRDGSAMRVADRIVQRERKAGNIELTNRPFWFWVGPKEEQA